MAKVETILQGGVGSIGRRCLLCDDRWDAKHPNDLNTLFCPNCLKLLKKVVDDARTCEKLR